MPLKEEIELENYLYQKIHPSCQTYNQNYEPLLKGQLIFCPLWPTYLLEHLVLNSDSSKSIPCQTLLMNLSVYFVSVLVHLWNFDQTTEKE